QVSALLTTFLVIEHIVCVQVPRAALKYYGANRDGSYGSFSRTTRVAAFFLGAGLRGTHHRYCQNLLQGRGVMAVTVGDALTVQPLTRANRSVGRGGSVRRAGNAGVDGIQRSGEAATVGLVHPFAIELFVEPARCFVIGDELLNGGVGFGKRGAEADELSADEV